MSRLQNEPPPSRERDPPPVAANLTITAIAAIKEIDAAAWDACANPHTTFEPGPAATTPLVAPSGCQKAGAEAQSSDQDLSFNPFLSHHFLAALETSKSAGGRTGWQPQHLLVQSAEGTLLAAAPCYLKSHSRGEYVFDAGWAEAFARAGGSYYPKLQVAVPFTPAPGRRLLVRPGAQAKEAQRALAASLLE